MPLAKIFAAPARYRLAEPLHMRLIVADLLNRDARPARPHRVHLSAALDWLCRAQDARDGAHDAGSVSAGWSFEDGWLPGYPETTGYIIETFIAASRTLGRPALLERAARMLGWELRIQHADGAFPGHFGEPGSRPVIFNTGQIMHGLLAGHVSLLCAECLPAAVRAGHWLARQQDADGCWRCFEYRDLPHTYNTRASWALLRTALLAGDPVLRKAAIANLDWALAQQNALGWFANNTFAASQPPVTHAIAYAVRGFLEAGVLLGDERYLGAAVSAARAVANAQHADGSFPGAFDERWRPAARYCCLTGVAQMSVNWLRLAQETGAADLRDHARRGIEYLKRHQRLAGPSPEVTGAVAGSSPIWGRYSMFEFPNWAAKFFADALIMDLEDTAVPARHVAAQPQPEQGHV
jgi:hypothetical protein